MITQIVKTLSTFMEPKGALPSPQQPITGPCHESDISESTSYHPLSGRSNLILYSHLCWPTYSDKWHAKFKSCLKLQLFNIHCLASGWTECSNTRPTTHANLTTLLLCMFDKCDRRCEDIKFLFYKLAVHVLITNSYQQIGNLWRPTHHE